MNKTYRKIQLVGNRSFSVSLPKDWILKNNLKKNDVIEIVEKGNELLIAKKNSNNGEETKKIFIEDLSILTAVLILCYTRGIFKFILKFKSKEDYLSAKPIVLENLSFLEGYKILEEGNDSITIIDSYKETNILIRELAKRNCVLLNNMIESILLSKTKTKEILEAEIDRIYHLSKRILYLCSTDSSFMKKNQIKDIEEIFLWRLIFKKFENIADVLENINKQTLEKEINDLLENLNEVFVLNKKSNLSKISLLKKRSYKNEKIDKIKELVIDVLNNYLLIELNKNLF
ncbi:MAG: AbrB/MazE/SpoVT family DNA-binding domain-containing protein [Candidatus Pacearchaeota archaeon]